jgi:hypothetical protein
METEQCFYYLAFQKKKKILAGYIILEGKPSEHFRIDRG